MKIIKEYLSEDKEVTLTGYIQDPSKEMASVAIKPAMLVLPGGAYLFLSDREAEPIALAYAARGFQTFVLRYSVGARARGGKPLAEASAAIGLIRKNAAEWHVAPDQVFTCGFSAGGHLSAWVGLCGEHKPNGMILCYAATEIYSTDRDLELRGRGEPNRIMDALLGPGYKEADAEALNLSNHVDGGSIPMFSWGTAEDALVRAPGLLRFAQAYAAAGRPFEFHMYQYGEHGLALSNHITANGRKSYTDQVAEGWLDLSVNWIRRNFGEPEIVDKPYEAVPGLNKDDK